MKKSCIICNSELKGNQQKFCSPTCKQKAQHQREKSNPNCAFSQTIRGYRRKLALIDLHGGKCKKCGYFSNIAALEFHHVNASDKQFSLDIRNLANKK